MFHPLHSYMYDVPGYPDLSCSSNMHIRVVSAKFGFSKHSFLETNHPCVFDFTGQYSEGQCSASRLSLGAWGGVSSVFKKKSLFLKKKSFSILHSSSLYQVHITGAFQAWTFHCCSFLSIRRRTRHVGGDHYFSDQIFFLFH